MGTVLQYRPRAIAPAVSESCRWHAAAESITASNLRILCAWQRVIWRTIWGV